MSRVVDITEMIEGQEIERRAAAIGELNRGVSGYSVWGDREIRQHRRDAQRVYELSRVEYAPGEFHLDPYEDVQAAWLAAQKELDGVTRRLAKISAQPYLYPRGELDRETEHAGQVFLKERELAARLAAS